MAQHISIERIGNEGVPVVVFDDFVPRPDLLVGDAAMLGFAPMGAHYPGIRAVVPPALVKKFVDALHPLIEEVFAVCDCTVIDALYSLVTTRPDGLTPIQRLPHFDGVDPGRLALLHFLSEAPGSGTAFYRHRTTGFETVTTARLPDYERTLAGEIGRDGVPTAAYINGGTALFEEVAVFEARHNRAILYPSNALHCARVPEDMVFSADVTTGRLTVNTFLRGHA